MSKSDYYQVLGVAKDADPEEIKKAFRAKARKLHPDVSDDPEAGKKFSELNEAYEILSDPEKKAKYDQLGHDRFVSGRPAEYASAQDIDFGDLGSIIDAMFGRSGGRSPHAGSGFGTGFGGGFAGVGGTQTRARRPARGHDLHVGLRVSLHDVHQGASKLISVPVGSAYRSIDIKIPKGVKSGAKLRLAGQGMPSPTQPGEPGDLYVKIQVDKDPRFERIDDGKDLQVELPLSIAEATLGAKVEVPTIEGKIVTLTIPPATVSGSRFRIGGHGLNAPKGKRGDLYTKIKIVPPSGAEITDSLRQALEAMKTDKQAPTNTTPKQLNEQASD